MLRLVEFSQHHFVLVGLAVLILLALAVDEALRRARKYQELSPAQSVMLINKGAKVLDLRTHVEFSTGHILNAHNIPFAELDDRASELDKMIAQPLLLCCKTGSDAATAAARLAKRGFQSITVLKGGIAAWQQEQLPLERG